MAKDTRLPSEKTSVTGKPLQMNSYTDKTKEDGKWGKCNLDYFIDRAVFGGLINTAAKSGGALDKFTKQDLYNAYNNLIPSELFDFVTDPLKAKNQDHKGFPAEIRSYNILRSDMDLYIGEWNKKPFLFDVVNADGDDAYNAFLAYKDETRKKNVTQRFINTSNEIAQKNQQEGTGLPSEEIPNPKTVTSALNLDYKDAKALKGYRALKVIELENKLREVWRTLFKDWIIGGDVFTLKLPMHGNLLYIKLSSMSVDYDRTNTLIRNVEDSDYAVVRFPVNTAQLVELLYDKLDEKQLQGLDKDNGTSYPGRLFNLWSANSNSGKTATTDKHDLFYVTWVSQKEIQFLTYPDPMTGEIQYDVVDEDYKVDKEAGESSEKFWVNTAWHGWRTEISGKNEYFGIEEIPAQRNLMNNFSSVKLPVNGKCFSDTESANVSLMYLGMPYQILYIILMYRMELTIAKSKGKIVLIDKNSIPQATEQDEEEFFYYAEALGYMAVDPENGMDLANYRVLDMSLFKDIKELIGLMDYVRSQWEELVGITRQRKGNMSSSEGLGTSEQAIFRSSVISDLIFTGFEEFLESELAGLLDLSKFAWVDGKKGYYRNDEDRLEMLDIEPDDYCSTEFGVFVTNMSKYMDKFRMLQGNVNAIAQRKDVKTSTIVDLVMTDSLTELKALIKKAEAQEQAIIERMASNEQQAKMEMEAAQRKWEEFKHYLDLDKQEKEWDRRDNNEFIKAEAQASVPVAGDTSSVGPDIAQLQKNSNDRLAAMEKNRVEQQKIQSDRQWQEIEREKIESQERMNKENNKTALKNKVTGQK